MSRYLVVIALLCASAAAQTGTAAIGKTCARQVSCDDALPPDTYSAVTGNDGLVHKWGDFLPECLDPNFKGPINVVSLGPCGLPDAPVPQPKPEPKPRPRFLAFGTSYKGVPVLRTNKQVLTDWTYLVPVASCAAAMTTDVLYTHGAREQFHSEVPVPLALAALSFLTHKYLWAPYTPGMASYCVQHYVRDAVK